MENTTILIYLQTDSGKIEKMSFDKIKDNITHEEGMEFANNIIENDIFYPIDGTKYVAVQKLQLVRTTIEEI